MEGGRGRKPSDVVPEAWLRPDRWLEARAREHPDRLAIVFREGRLSYADLWERVVRLGAALWRRGLRPADRIACLSTNHPAFLETYFAASLVGGVFVPLNFRLALPELLYQLEDSAPRALILGPRHGHLEEALRATSLPTPPRVHPVREPGAPEGEHYESLLATEDPTPPDGGGRPFTPEDPQIIMYTSGTTGRPKGAVLPYRKTLYNSLNAAVFFELSDADGVLVPVPLFHSLGLNILSVPVLFGGGVVVLLEKFAAENVARAIRESPVTFMGAVPTIYKRLLEHGLERSGLAGLRFCFTAGAPIPASLIRTYHAAGVLLKQGFGQTETSILCCLDARDALRKAGSVGKPVVHGEVKVVNEQLQEVPPDRVGEIVARGPIVMSGYWNRPQETDRAFHGSWLRTQDLAVRDEEGFITLVGRKGDTYISGGENVYPEEVERVYRLHPFVDEVAVIGVPDEDLGEVGLACIVRRGPDPLDPDGLRRFGEEHLARYKIPRSFVEMDRLPRTVTGKVQKFMLRKRFHSNTPGRG